MSKLNMKKSIFDAVIVHLASMDACSFKLITFQQRLVDLGFNIRKSTLFNYLDYIIQAGYGIDKLKPSGSTEVFYRVTGNIPIDLSFSQIFNRACALRKERGVITTKKVNYFPIDKLIYNEEKKREVCETLSKRPLGWKARSDSVYKTIYNMLLEMEVRSIFNRKDLEVIASARNLEIKPSTVTNYLNAIFQSDCGLERVKLAGARQPVHYLITKDLPTELTSSFFRKVAKGEKRETRIVEGQPRTSIKFRDPKLEEIWSSIKEKQKMTTNSISKEESIEPIEEIKEDTQETHVLDSIYTDADLGKKVFAYMVDRENTIKSLEKKVQELEPFVNGFSEIKKELDLKKEELDHKNAKILQLESDLATKDVRLAEIELELDQIKQDGKISLREKLRSFSS